MASATPHSQMSRPRCVADPALLLIALLLVPACHRLGPRPSGSKSGPRAESSRLAESVSKAVGAEASAVLGSGSTVSHHQRAPKLRRRHLGSGTSDGFLPRPGWNSIGGSCEEGGPTLELAKEQTPAPGHHLRGRVAPIAVGPNITAVLFIGAPPEHSGRTEFPLDLGPLGMPGCILRVAPDLVMPLPVSSGSARVRIQIPDNPLLGGCRFYLQAMVSAPGANAAQRILSDAIEVCLGHR